MPVVSALDSPLLEVFKDEKTRSLAKAAGNGNVQMINMLVGQGVEVNSKGEKGLTPLFWAMRQKNRNGFNALLKRGADPNLLFDDGGSVMYWSILHSDKYYLEQALVNGGNPNIKGGAFGGTIIFSALGTQSDKLDMLITHGVDLNALNQFGSSPAIVAASLGNFDVALKLLKAGANSRIVNNSGATLGSVLLDKEKILEPNSQKFKDLLLLKKYLVSQN